MHVNYADLNAQPGFLSDFAQGAGVDVVLEVPAEKMQFWVVDWVMWSYDDDVAGTLRIAYDDVTIYEHDITRGGPGLLNFDTKELYHATDKRKAIPNEKLTVTLVGAGGSVGKLSVRYR